MSMDEEKILQILSDKRINYFDEQINTPMLKTIKAIIPYMDFQRQKTFAIMTKIIEIHMLTQIYDQKEQPHNTSDMNMALLNALKIHMSDSELAALRNFFTVKNIIQKTNSDENKQNLCDSDLNIDKANSIFQDDTFKNLSESNKKLLSDFLTDIKDKSPIEVVNIMLEYNKKIPEDITAEQKIAMTKALLYRLPEEQQKQFLNLYNTFLKDNK